MPTVYFTKDLITKELRPLSEFDRQTWEQIQQRTKPNAVLEATVKQKRSLPKHKKFIMLCQTLYELDGIKDHYPSWNHLRVDLQVRNGHYEEYITQAGELVFVPKSISFDELDEQEFLELYSKIIDYVLQEFIPEYAKREGPTGFTDLEKYINTVMEFV